MLIHPTFTSTVYDDEMLLVVQTVEEKDKWANVRAPPPTADVARLTWKSGWARVDPAAIQ